MLESLADVDHAAWPSKVVLGQAGKWPWEPTCKTSPSSPPPAGSVLLLFKVGFLNFGTLDTWTGSFLGGWVVEGLVLCLETEQCITGLCSPAAQENPS